MEGLVVQGEKNAESELQLQSVLFNIPVSTIASICLIHRVFKIGLAPVLDEVIRFWKTLTEPIADILRLIINTIHLDMPAWYPDAVILQVILFSILVRNLDGNKNRFRNGMLVLVLSMLLTFPLLWHNFWDDDRPEETRAARRDFLAVANLTLLVFVANVIVR
jgi:hypothetical protein